MTTIYKKVGERIRKFRKKAKLTQEELAYRAKIEPRSIVQIEAGKRNPTIKTIRKIALALKVKISDLVD